MVEPVDGDVGPDRREERDGEVPRAPAEAAGEDQRGVEQRERGPAGDDLVPVEPEPVAGEQEADDGGDADGVEPPGAGPPGEVRLPVAAVDEPAERREAGGDDGLEEGGVELGGRR